MATEALGTGLAEHRPCKVPVQDKLSPDISTHSQGQQRTLWLHNTHLKPWVTLLRYDKREQLLVKMENQKNRAVTEKSEAGTEFRTSRRAGFLIQIKEP